MRSCLLAIVAVVLIGVAPPSEAKPINKVSMKHSPDRRVEAIWRLYENPPKKGIGEDWVEALVFAMGDQGIGHGGFDVQHEAYRAAYHLEMPDGRTVLERIMDEAFHCGFAVDFLSEEASRLAQPPLQGSPLPPIPSEELTALIASQTCADASTFLWSAFDDAMVLDEGEPLTDWILARASQDDLDAYLDCYGHLQEYASIFAAVVPEEVGTGFQEAASYNVRALALNADPVNRALGLEPLAFDRNEGILGGQIAELLDEDVWQQLDVALRSAAQDYVRIQDPDLARRVMMSLFISKRTMGAYFGKERFEELIVEAGGRL